MVVHFLVAFLSSLGSSANPKCFDVNATVLERDMATASWSPESHPILRSLSLNSHENNIP